MGRGSVRFYGDGEGEEYGGDTVMAKDKDSMTMQICRTKSDIIAQNRATMGHSQTLLTLEEEEKVAALLRDKDDEDTAER